MAWLESAHLPIVLGSGVTAGLIELGRYAHSLRHRRRLPRMSVLVCGLAAAVLLASAGGVLAAALVVESLADKPWTAYALGSTLGVSVNMATRSGPLRLLALCLRGISRILESSQRSNNSNDDDESTNGTRSD